MKIKPARGGGDTMLLEELRDKYPNAVRLLEAKPEGMETSEIESLLDFIERGHNDTVKYGYPFWIEFRAKVYRDGEHFITATELKTDKKPEADKRGTHNFKYKDEGPLFVDGGDSDAEAETGEDIEA